MILEFFQHTCLNFPYMHVGIFPTSKKTAKPGPLPTDRFFQASGKKDYCAFFPTTISESVAEVTA